ncbi:hypothetical protein L7F22_028250 [Adiantum nelumboides]|nr:hypothetical protein [Adiantum nelumboides]
MNATRCATATLDTSRLELQRKIKRRLLVTPWGCFAYRVMPFGLINAPATFQRYVTHLFQPFFGKSIRVFIDDFCIYSSHSLHLEKVYETFCRLQTLGGQLNVEKCHIVESKVALLGHVISEKGIEEDPSKVQALVSLPPLTTTKQLVSFLQKILKWKKPECPHFETEFYGPLRLKPGVAAITGLMFKPLKALDYASELHFTATKESFSVALKGLCSAGHVQCQAVLNFGRHAVSSTTQKLFQFTNSGSEATSFEWIVEPPFSIFPKMGQIKPGESVLLLAISHQKRPNCTLPRYTSFQINPSILDFGDVVVGSAKQLTFSILNTSNVVAKVCLDLVGDCIHPSSAVFKLDLIEASILPNEQLSVKGLGLCLRQGSSCLVDL